MNRAFVEAHLVELVADWLLESTNGEIRSCADCGARTMHKRCAPCEQARYLKPARRARKLLEAA